MRAEGLRPMQRQHVHLSPEKETASRVARRHGADVVVLTVKAASAFRAGVRFDHRENHVWICEAIPPEFIDL
ncbi:RNA 2'-phosphotransferase [Leifsonia sp. LS1]|uniref:RNA 2'-phosphotransferase n=1 Tax=Leifsonia sp. LS1 TaxID=2828483 RepID=UPI0035B65F17